MELPAFSWRFDRNSFVRDAKEWVRLPVIDACRRTPRQYQDHGPRGADPRGSHLRTIKRYSSRRLW